MDKQMNQEPKNEEVQEQANVNEKQSSHKIKFNDKKALLFGIALVAVVFLVFNAGKSAAIDEEVINARIEADALYQEKMGQLGDAKSELVTVKTKIKKNQAMIDDAQKYYGEKEKADNDLAIFQEELKELEGDISGKKAQLEKLTGDIIKAKGSPIRLPAGYFTVGKDIEPGRYKVTGNSNFVVYSGFGDLKVNTILGGRYGVESFVCELGTGDALRCDGSDTFTPIN